MSDSAIRFAEYKGSYAKVEALPKGPMPEIAFVGRSNVGKSSLINFLSGRLGMAHTSSQPGKTQTFNYYLINEEVNWVDMPGYGYAKVSQKQRDAWQKEMQKYLAEREQMRVVCQLIDSRIKPQKIDLEFTHACLKGEVPIVLIFTKGDRKGRNEAKSNQAAYDRALREFKLSVPRQFMTSASDKTGREEILNWIEELLAES